MLEKLKNTVFEANLELVESGLVIHTWEMSVEETERVDLL